MAKIRFLLDIHIDRAIAKGLQKRGIETLTGQDAGLDFKSDATVLAFAFENGWLVVIQDDDFLSLAYQKPHFGIAFCQNHRTIGQVIEGLSLIHAVLERDEMIGKVEFI